MIRVLLCLASLALMASSPARDALAALPPDFVDEQVVGGLALPVGMTRLPDERILVIEQNTGDIHAVVQGALVATAAYTVSDLNSSGNERGLLGIAVDPGWPARPYVYIAYNRTPPGDMAIVRLTGSGDLDDGASQTLGFASPYVVLGGVPDAASNHNAGTLRFGPDDMLYASLGDDASECTAQDSTDFRGVILRMDVSGLPVSGTGPADPADLVPAGNPFPASPPGSGLAYALGLRNPFRFTVDPITGRLFIGDVGNSAFEELDVCEGGENFGWPFREAGLVRNPDGCNEPGGSGNYPDYTPPIASYSHSGQGALSVIAGPVYRPVNGGAHAFPGIYNGVVFYCEYYVGFIRAMQESSGTWQPFTVPGQPNGSDWATNTAFVSDMAVGPEGELLYLNQIAGELRRIRYTGSVTGVGEGTPGPALSAAPNPAGGRNATRLTAAWPVEGPATVRVVDVRGGVLRRWATRATPSVTVSWDGTDERGRRVPPGVYFLHVEGGGHRAAVRVVRLP